MAIINGDGLDLTEVGYDPSYGVKHVRFDHDFHFAGLAYDGVEMRVSITVPDIDAAVALAERLRAYVPEYLDNGGWVQ